METLYTYIYIYIYILFLVLSIFWNCLVYFLLFIFLGFFDFQNVIVFVGVCFVLSSVVLNVFIGFCVIFRIYDYVLRVWFVNIFWNISRSVNNSRTNCLFRAAVTCCDLLPPPPHPRRQCQSSLPGEKYGNKILLFIFWVLLRFVGIFGPPTSLATVKVPLRKKK